MKNICKTISITIIASLGLSACGALTTSLPNQGHHIYPLKAQTIRTDQLLKLCPLPDKKKDFYNSKNTGLECLKDYSSKGYHVASYHYGNILYLIYVHDLQTINANKKYLPQKNKKMNDKYQTEKIAELNRVNEIKYNALQYLNLSAASVVKLYQSVHDMNKYKLEDRVILSESITILEKETTSEETKQKIENGIRALSNTLIYIRKGGEKSHP